MTVVAKAEDLTTQKSSASNLYISMVNCVCDHVLGPVSDEEKELVRKQKARNQCRIRRHRAYEQKKERLALITLYLLHKRYDLAIEEIEKPGLMNLASGELLIRAAYRGGGHIPVIQKVLDLGVDEENVHWISAALRSAAREGLWETSFFLYDVLRKHKGYGKESNFIPRDLMGALTDAACKGYIPFMLKIMSDAHIKKILWTRGNHRASVGCSPTILHAAIQGNRIVVVNFLLKQGAPQGFTTGYTAYGDETEVKKAKRLGYVRIVEILEHLQEELDLIAQENVEEEVSNTPECKKSILRLIKELPQDESKRSIIYNRLMACSALASPFVIDAAGNTILHKAAEIVDGGLFGRILYLNSELIAVKNKRGEMPLEIGVGMGGKGMLEIFGKEIVH